MIQIRWPCRTSSRLEGSSTVGSRRVPPGDTSSRWRIGELASSDLLVEFPNLFSGERLRDQGRRCPREGELDGNVVREHLKGRDVVATTEDGESCRLPIETVDGTASATPRALDQHIPERRCKRQ